MQRESRGPYVIAGAYLLTGLAYIALSDHLAAALATSPEGLTTIQTYKGWVFIGVTTVLLFFALRVYARRKEAVAEQLRSSEEEIRENLRQKELLIQELHHRVKNNMQVIISMLRLTGAGAASAGAASARAASARAAPTRAAAPAEAPRGSEALGAAVGRVVDRVYAMALVHDRIFRSDTATEVDARGYIEELSRYVAAQRGRRGVRVEVTAAEAPMHIDTAIPCGLIINEAVTNALQHAFPGERTGTVQVVYETDGRWHRLTISDNGGGYNADAATDAMGLTLIRSMATQLEGEVQTGTGVTGTRVAVTFPVKPRKILHQ